MNVNAIQESLDRHWAAPAANNFEAEHDIYQEDAALVYPRSGGRTSEAGTTFILAYDGRSSYRVNVMEFQDGRVVRGTQYFGDLFESGPSCARWVERME